MNVKRGCLGKEKDHLFIRDWGERSKSGKIVSRVFEMMRMGGVGAHIT